MIHVEAILEHNFIRVSIQICNYTSENTGEFTGSKCRQHYQIQHNRSYTILMYKIKHYYNIHVTNSKPIETLLTYLLTYSMVQSSFCETNWFAASQEIPPHFTEPEGSLPHSQASATCLYPGPAQSSPYTHITPPGDLS